MQLLHLINGNPGEAFVDGFMAGVSSFAIFKIPLLILAVALLVFGGFRERLYVGLVILCVVIGDGGINKQVKSLVNRPRPHESLEGIRVVTTDGVTMSKPQPVAKGRSFPSGHAANNVVMAFLATWIYGRKAWPLWLMAMLVSYSRIYTGSHYPTDIVGSWVMAVLYTWVIVRGCRWGWERWLPVWHRRHRIEILGARE